MRALLILLLAACTPPPDDLPDPADDPVPPWPEWAFEHWAWEDESTQESVLALVQGYQDRDIPLGAVIVDSPWETAYNDFVFDEALFPDPEGLVEELHDRDVRLFLWITQMVNIDAGPVWDQGVAGDYFMRASAEATEPAVVHWWKGDGALVDFGNPEAVAWWKGLMDPILDLGIDGWKTDGSDFSASLAPYSPGLGRELSRLEYSHLYYRMFFDYTRERLGDDRLITARPVDNYGADLGGDGVAFAPVDITWAGWVGDQDPGFEGLQAALRNFWWSADYGYVAFGSDIGGYREDDAFPLGRDREPFLRWAGLGAFSPIMENGGGGAHEPWRFDEEATAIYRDFVRMHDAIRPYLMRQGALAFDEGRSLFDFLDPSTTSYRYRLGPDLFVQPVVEPGEDVRVILPDGEWRWLFGDGGVYDGPAVRDFVVPIADYPAFVRVGSRLDGELP